jgi:NAD(P)-dependent dehydrogenase (short-subunit alcohol dehydrogenase family)
MTTNMVDWHREYAGKTVCVVGGTSGIGAAIAAALVACGARVLLTGASAESVTQAAAKFPRAHCRVLDVRAAGAIDDFCVSFERLDLLVNALGISRAFRELEPESLGELIEVNLASVARLSAGLYPALKTARGAVVNFASMTSFFGSSSNPIYAASKGGIVQLTKSFALAWGGEGIRVNAVAPGYVRTRLTERRWADAAGAQEILRRTPLGRWGEPDDLVGPTLFLGSSAAAFITGVVLPVDGGYLVA